MDREPVASFDVDSSDKESGWSGKRYAERLGRKSKEYTIQLLEIPVWFFFTAMSLMYGFMKTIINVFNADDVIHGPETKKTIERFTKGGANIKDQINKILKKLKKEPKYKEAVQERLNDKFNKNPEKFTNKIKSIFGYDSIPLKKHHIHLFWLFINWRLMGSTTDKNNWEIMNNKLNKTHDSKTITEIIEVAYRSAHKTGGSTPREIYWFNEYRTMKKLYKQLKISQRY